MADVVFSPEARDDLREIWLFIARDNPSAANRVIAEVRKASELLSAQPKLGAKRPDYFGLRMWVLPRYRSFLMFYRLQSEEDVCSVEIVRVLRGSQDLSEILAPPFDED